MIDRRKMNGPRALRLLELEPEQATPTAVRQAYLDLVRVWHPDRFGADERLQRKAAGRLSEINLAYEFLIANPLPPTASGSDGQRGQTQAWGVTPAGSPPASPRRRRSRSLRRAARTLGQFGIAAAFIAALFFIATPRAAQVSSTPEGRADTPLRSQSTLAARPPMAEPPPAVTPHGHARSPFSRDLDRVLARVEADSRAANHR